MEPRKVIIQIAGRQYPLSVDSAEEEKIRRAGKKLEEMIKEFEKSFGIRDKQDALAMACIRLGVEVENAEMKSQKIHDYLQEEIISLQKEFQS